MLVELRRVPLSCNFILVTQGSTWKLMSEIVSAFITGNLFVPDQEIEISSKNKNIYQYIM